VGRVVLTLLIDFFMADRLYWRMQLECVELSEMEFSVTFVHLIANVPYFGSKVAQEYNTEDLKDNH
jgi:hypothetical protein